MLAIQHTKHLNNFIITTNDERHLLATFQTDLTTIRQSRGLFRTGQHFIHPHTVTFPFHRLVEVIHITEVVAQVRHDTVEMTVTGVMTEINMVLNAFEITRQNVIRMAGNAGIMGRTQNTNTDIQSTTIATKSPSSL